MHNIDQWKGVCVHIYTHTYIKIYLGGGTKTTYLFSKQTLHFSPQHKAQSLKKYHCVKKLHFLTTWETFPVGRTGKVLSSWLHSG